MTLGGAVAFFLLGLLVASYGPLLPQVQEDFGVSSSSAGLLLGAHAAGGVVGILLAGLGGARLPVRWRLLVAALVVVAGCTGAALAPTWPVLLTCVVLAGSGWGGFELDVNVLFASTRGTRSAAVLTLVSAAFGLGAVLAPAAVAVGAGRTSVLLASAAVAALTIPLLATAPDSARPDTAPGGHRADRTSGPARRAHLTGVQLGLTAVLVVYVGAEAGVAGWMSTHLVHAAGAGAGGAAAVTSSFWIAFTLGRLLAAPISLRLAPAPLLLASLLLAGAGLVLASTGSAVRTGYVLTGLFLAPVFPTAFAWLAARGPLAPGAGALVLAAASAGPVLTAPVIGASHDTWGPSAIPATLLAVVLLDAAVVLGLASRTRHRPAAEPATRTA
ncbi:sugar MFS transporter [Quadrisphaera sp. DSM 44207]|uniref:MFS transporter n=1 Tax=Quadrisphaera sp. DSM 44207 TaxID=1881057 RepID=UPI0008912887|nr:MFS transporter [Quadrisphaera sp. DSM 44207]SDQ49725.1 Fucose permease [Quadrisphaera sp. DSM 44207]